MSKIISLVMVLVLGLSMAGCNQQEETITPTLIPDEISSIEVTHDFYPLEITKELDNDEIVIIKEWAAALEWEQTPLGEEETPDSYAGGEAWIFHVNNGEITFTYVYQGVSSAILIDSEWYAVENPSNPPVEIK